MYQRIVVTLVISICCLVSVQSTVNRVISIPGRGAVIGTDPIYSDRTIKLLPQESIKIVSTNNSLDTKYVLFQVHSQLDAIVMSYDDPSISHRIKPDRQVIGNNIGLIVYLKGEESNGEIFVKNTNHKSLMVLVITSTHSAADPVPGGCNMEFNVETSPFLRLSSNKLRNRIEWQQAAIGSKRKPQNFDTTLPKPIGVVNHRSTNTGHSSDIDRSSTRYRDLNERPNTHHSVRSPNSNFDTLVTTSSCDTSYNFVTYQTYAYYLKENDYSIEEYFRGIKLMSDPKMVLKYAKSRDSMSIRKPSQPSRTKALFLSYPGRGVIFTVLAFTVTSSATMVSPYSIISPPKSHLDTTTASPKFLATNLVSKVVTYFSPPDIDTQSVTTRSISYVPIATYNCDLNQGIETCGKLYGIWNVMFVSFLAVSGLILSLRGHQWFDFQVMWSSFVLSAILLFILITKYSEFTPFERDIVVIVGSICISCLWLFLWKLIGSPILTLLTSGLLLGFLVTSAVLFTTLGNDDLFRNDLNYWLIMGCGTFIIPIALIPFAVLMSVFSCSIVGSFSLVFTIDRFIGGSVSFIVINVFKRAIYSRDVDNELYQALNNVPLQGKDVVLLITWFVLSLVGMCLQVYFSLDQPHAFPSNNNSCCRPRIVDLNTVNVTSYPITGSRTRRRSSRSGRRRRRSRSRSVGSGRVRSSSTRRNAQATVIDPEVSSIVGSGSQVVIVRPSAPPTETAEEIRPLLCDPIPIHGYAATNFNNV